MSPFLNRRTGKTRPLTFKPAWSVGNAALWDGPTKLAAPALDSCSGLVVHAPNHLGDCVMALPLIGRLRERLGDRLVVVTRTEFRDVWKLVADDVNIIPYAGWYPGELKHLRLRLRKSGCDMALLLATGIEVPWLYLRAGIRHRLGYDYWGRGFLLTARLKSGGTPTAAPLCLEHHSVNMMRLLNLVHPSFDPDPSMPDAGRRLPPAAEPGAGKGSLVLGVVVGGNSPDKEFAPDFWISVIKALHTGRPVRTVLLLGTSAHARAAVTIAEQVPGCRNLCGRTTVGQLIALLRDCDLVLSPDTGTAHLSARLGAPTLSLFTSGSPTWTRPQGPFVEVISSSVSCAPCYNATPCGHRHRCTSRFNADDVAARAGRLIERSAQACS